MKLIIATSILITIIVFSLVIIKNKTIQHFQDTNQNPLENKLNEIKDLLETDDNDLVEKKKNKIQELINSNYYNKYKNIPKIVEFLKRQNKKYSNYGNGTPCDFDKEIKKKIKLGSDKHLDSKKLRQYRKGLIVKKKVEELTKFIDEKSAELELELDKNSKTHGSLRNVNTGSYLNYINNEDDQDNIVIYAKGQKFEKEVSDGNGDIVGCLSHKNEEDDKENKVYSFNSPAIKTDCDLSSVDENLKFRKHVINNIDDYKEKLGKDIKLNPWDSYNYPFTIIKPSDSEKYCLSNMEDKLRIKKCNSSSDMRYYDSRKQKNLGCPI